MNSEPREAVNAEPPATPEPAAPMPGTPASTISVLQQRVIEREQYGGEVKAQPGEIRAVIESLENWKALATTLQDEANRERAKVAELEARIPAARESLLRFLTTGNAAREAFLIEPAAKGYDALHGRYRARLWPMGDQTNEEWRAFLDGLTASWNFALGGAALLDKAVAREDEMRAALARANEALRCVFATYPHEQHFWQTYPAALDAIRIAAGAQGSAAQKPEGPQ